MATIKDVAKKAKVSVATVSAIINSDSNVKVSKKLTRRVEKAILELNYRPNRIARALSKKETHTIAYVVPSIRNEFFAQIAHFIEDYAFAEGYGVYLCNTHSNLERVNLYRDNLIENRVGGVITTLTWEITQGDFINSFQKEGIPIVGLAGARIIKTIDTVTINDQAGTKLAINYLFSKQHSKIGFIGSRDSKTTSIRLLGYKKAFKEANLKIDSNLIELGKAFSRDEGYLLAKKLIQKNSKVSAIFVYNDVMAAGVIELLNDLGLAVPNDIAVIGYDDSIAKYIRPKLTTMALPKEKMVNNTMQILFQRINKKAGEIIHRKVLPEIIQRDST